MLPLAPLVYRGALEARRSSATSDQVPTTSAFISYLKALKSAFQKLVILLSPQPAGPTSKTFMPLRCAMVEPTMVRPVQGQSIIQITMPLSSKTRTDTGSRQSAITHSLLASKGGVIPVTLPVMFNATEG